MSFGRKGLVSGQTAPAQGGGLGNAAPAASVATARSEPSVQNADHEDIEMKREAFIAAERARSGKISAPSAPAGNPDPLINLRNMSRPARPAQPIETREVGETGLPVDQEKEIRAMARGMARGRVPGVAPSVSSGGMASGSSGGSSIFGDPNKRRIEVAYIWWFFLGQFSMHRFYCGEKESAIIQVAMWVGSLVTLFIFPPIGLVGLLLWMCWIIGDLFMIPGMLKKLKADHDYSGVFA